MNDFRKGNFRGNLRTNQNYREQNFRGGYRQIIGMTIMKKAEVGLEKDSFQIMSEGMVEIVVIGLDQDQEPVQKEI